MEEFEASDSVVLSVEIGLCLGILADHLRALETLEVPASV